MGRGTTIEFVEVFNNSDDGVEFFGGTVNTRFMVMAFNEDESFDIDQGYRGKNQFWFAIQKSVGTGSNYGGEHDGGDSPDQDAGAIRALASVQCDVHRSWSWDGPTTSPTRRSA